MELKLNVYLKATPETASFNRTIVELKRYHPPYHPAGCLPFNRTIVELKLNFSWSLIVCPSLLIVP